MSDVCESMLRELLGFNREPFIPFKDQGEVEFGSNQPCETCGYTGEDGEDAFHTAKCTVVDPDFDCMDEGSSEDFSVDDSSVGVGFPIEDVDWDVFVVSCPEKDTTMTYGDLPLLPDPLEVHPTPYMLMARLREKDYDKWEELIPTYNQFTKDDCVCSDGTCMGPGDEDCRTDVTCSRCHGTLRCNECHGWGNPISSEEWM